MFGALIIGDEILSGKRQDKHFPKIVELLKARGLGLSWSMNLPDDPEIITQVLTSTLARPDIVFSFGGIGATPDDHTRQCAAKAAGVELQVASRCEARDRSALRHRGLSQAHPDGRISGRQSHHSQSLQPRARIQSRPAPLSARISGDGVADDGMGARHRIPAPAQRGTAGGPGDRGQGRGREPAHRSDERLHCAIPSAEIVQPAELYARLAGASNSASKAKRSWPRKPSNSSSTASVRWALPGIPESRHQALGTRRGGKAPRPDLERRASCLIFI